MDCRHPVPETDNRGLLFATDLGVDVPDGVDVFGVHTTEGTTD